MGMASFSRDDWIEAAYLRFNDAGLSAVRVEAIARDLGATKGSFYWHFADRAEVVSAVMARWEQIETDLVIELVERAGSPEEQLAALYDVIVERIGERGGERTLFLDAVPEAVDAVVARVTERRVAYVAALLHAAGVEQGEARRRGAAVVAAVIGFQQLAAGGWRAGPEVDTRELTASILRMSLSANGR
jgi:AcrR family transcriptional regulator